MGKLTTGLWYREGSSAGRGASLVFADAAVSVVAVDGTVLSAAAFDQIGISDRVGSIPRRLTYPDRTSFETMDNGAIDGLVAAQKGRSAGWIHRLERVHPRLLALAPLAFVFALSPYRFSVPPPVAVALVGPPPVVPPPLARGSMEGAGPGPPAPAGGVGPAPPSRPGPPPPGSSTPPGAPRGPPPW